MSLPLTTIKRQPPEAARYSIIWLHGLGADGHDFEGIVPELHLKAEAQIRFIFPNAPMQAVTVNGGLRMRAWYDILEKSVVRRVDLQGIYQSSAAIEVLIEQEIAQGIPSEAILLAGFSQGGVIALHTGLRYRYKLAGIIALSTYLPTLDHLKTEASPANKQIPILMAHGSFDSIVSLHSGKMAFNALAKQNYPIQWFEYPMDHSVCHKELIDIGDFINAIFKIQ